MLNDYDDGCKGDDEDSDADCEDYENLFKEKLNSVLVLGLAAHVSRPELSPHLVASDDAILIANS